VNKETHGGKKSGSGRGTEEDHSSSRKGGRLGGAAAAKRPAAERSRSATKAARTESAAPPNMIGRPSWASNPFISRELRASRRADLRSSQLLLPEPHAGEQRKEP
jgi:hypothetical protein